jgi:uncharacterized repeat protein (TIGR03803 family)
MHGSSNKNAATAGGSTGGAMQSKETTALRGILSLVVFSAVTVCSAASALAQTETVLYSFQGSPDGEIACCGQPVLDKVGNAYGTTLDGGANSLGTVWKVTPSGTETVLWSFGSGSDGDTPVGLIMDKHGNLFGTTLGGGADNLGTVFEITPSGTETVLWNFGNGTDGTQPGNGVILDNNGNLFGTTQTGGAYNGGTVYELTPSGTETILWSFGNGNDGMAPDGTILNVNGTLYGTTRLGGGVPDSGTVWELSPSGTETVLHSFVTQEGGQPDGNVVMDAKGNLYGNCHTGGPNEDGTVFKLTPSGKLKVIHAFDGTDGINPYALIVLDKKGNLYSTTHEGGTYNGGTVWESTRSGKLTVLWNLGNGTDGNETTSGVALDRQGNVYGMTQYGGTGICHKGTRPGCGVVFKVTP